MKNKKIKRIKKGNFKRIKNFLFLFILLFILSVNSILAIGITPARTIYNFESGMSKQINFTIINSQEKDMLVVFYIRGDLGKYISLENEYYQFSSDEKNKVFSCNLNLPESLGSPGEHKAEIVAVELPKGIDYKERELTSIGSVVGVITEVFVLVPYPGKYIDAEVNVITSADKIVFAIPIINKGKLDILDTRVIIDLHDSENKKIKTLESNRISIGSLKKNQINLEWDVSDVLPGKYNAKAFIFYDNEVKNLEKSFEIGEQTIEILEITVRDFNLGSIAKFNALVESRWSSEIKNLHMNIIIYDHDNEVMADFNSPSYNLPPLGKIEIFSYWDTAGVKTGTYNGKIILKYGESHKERDVQFRVSKDSIEVVGLTGRVVVKRDEGFNFNTILIIVVVVLILVNVMWFLFFRRVINNLIKKIKK